MSALDHIKWSETDYDMKDFVELFSYSLPVLCQTTTGYSGCDEDIHQVGADEIYWIYEILRQQRIVAKDTEERYISIPVNKCKYKFQIVGEDDERGAKVTPKTLLENLRQNQSNQIRFMFEKDQVVSYQIGADIGDATKFGVMTLKESYEEKYLLGFGMHSGLLFCRTVGIPVYMDISFCRAIGFNEDEKGGPRFKRWTEALKVLVDSTEKANIKTCQAIIVFTERPSDGDYEYIRPNFLVDSRNKPNKKQPSNDVLDTSNEYSYIIGREINTQIQEPVDAGNESPLEDESMSNTMHRHSEILTTELPPLPRRRPPTPPLTANDRPVEGSNSTNTDERNPPAIPSRQSKSKGHYDHPRRMGDNADYENHRAEVTGKVMSRMDDDGDNEGDLYDDVELSSAKTLKNNSSPIEINSTDSMLKVSSEHLSSCSGMRSASPASRAFLADNASMARSNTRAVHSGLAIYDSAGQVPVDVDVDMWTVSDVVDLLRLLKMNNHRDAFRQQEIDGALLLSLDEKTLVDDFGFKQFEATKVVMFIRKGWRPK